MKKTHDKLLNRYLLHEHLTADLAGDVVDSVETDSGTVTPASNSFTLSGGQGIGTSGTGSTGTIAVADDVIESVGSDSGTVTPSSNAFNIVGGEGIDTSGATTNITIAGEDASTTNKGIASFYSEDFSVSSGQVQVVDSIVRVLTGDTGTATGSSHGISVRGGEGIDTSAAGVELDISGEDASDTNKGIASFDAAHFSVSSGAVSLAADGVDDTLIDWGTGANQVSAVDMPIADSGNYYTGTEVETALQEIGDGTTLDSRYFNSSDIAAKGDLIAGTANDTTGILSVGTNNYLLTPASGETTGLKYVAAMPTTTKCKAYVGTSQSLTANTLTKIQLDTEDYDPGLNFDATTNYRFTAPVDGYYLFKAQLTYLVTAANDRIDILFRENGTTDHSFKRTKSLDGDPVYIDTSDVISLSANDYVELYGKNVDNDDTVYFGNQQSYMTVHLLSV